MWSPYRVLQYQPLSDSLINDGLTETYARLDSWRYDLQIRQGRYFWASSRKRELSFVPRHWFVVSL